MIVLNKENKHEIMNKKKDIILFILIPFLYGISNAQEKELTWEELREIYESADFRHKIINIHDDRLNKIFNYIGLNYTQSLIHSDRL